VKARVLAKFSEEIKMLKRKRAAWLSGFGPLLITMCMASSSPVARSGVLQDPQQSPAEPDNTKKNLPTNHHDANRADQQSNSTSDVELTRKIRRSLTQDSSLSTYAHNVKIITRNGVVELKGPVKSQSEKDAVEAKATDIAGASKVKNELTVKAEK
jgi:hyperosmotically inducible protein